jgi:hypothetical protein
MAGMHVKQVARRKQKMQKMQTCLPVGRRVRGMEALKKTEGLAAFL